MRRSRASPRTPTRAPGFSASAAGQASALDAAVVGIAGGAPTAADRTLRRAPVVLAHQPRLRRPVAGVEQCMPLVPGAVGIAVLQAPDQGERRALKAPACAELQRRMVVEQLGALADLAQRIAVADDRAAAEAADRKRRRRRAELDRSAAVRTGGAVGALGRRVGGNGAVQRRGRSKRRPSPSRNLGRFFSNSAFLRRTLPAD